MKFQKDEMVFVRARGHQTDGMEATVIRVGPFMEGAILSGPPARGNNRTLRGANADYEVIVSDGKHWFVDECSLRKIPPKETPAEDTFQQDLKRWLGQGVEA